MYKKISENTISWFYFSALFCIILSVFFNFFDEKISRILFFISCYISIIGLVFFRVGIHKLDLMIILSLGFIGLSKLFWFALEYIGNPDFDVYDSYLATGKRLLLSALIAWFLLSVRRRRRVLNEKIIKNTLVISFITASCIGFFQYIHGIDRVDFYVGRSTDAAYMYAALSVAVIFTQAKSGNITNLFLAGIVFLIALYMIFLTGTRNVMFSLPFVIMSIGLLKFRHLGWKIFLTVILAVGIVTGASYQRIIKPKIDETKTQLAIYEQTDGNKASSLGSRLAMWHVGVASFLQHPLGISKEGRTEWFKQYVAEHKTDRSSLDFVNIHLHNEFIDTASLQGIQGILVLLFFYVSMIYYAVKTCNSALLATVFVVIISGFTDVVFISREQSIFFPIIFILVVLWNDGMPQKQGILLKQ